MGTESLHLLGLTLPKAQLYLVVPLLFVLWMAWVDVKSNRIPNYLTLACALAGLAYQLWAHGWPGLTDGFLGLCLGFALLFVFYLMGGLGAGDVKALAALGAWLGPWQTIYLFIYMAFAGVLLIVVFLWWRGLLWGKILQLYEFFLNLILLGSSSRSQAKATQTPKGERLPYALAIALGMVFFCWHKFTR